MKCSIVVVSGATGSGKTELSQRIARVTGSCVCNVGDALRGALERVGVQVPEREQLGLEFLRRWTREDYRDLVGRLVQTGAIIDGVRLVEGVEGARRGGLVLHVHRTGCDGGGCTVGKSSLDPYQRDTQELGRMADIRVDWVRDVVRLERVVQDKILPLLK